jgi:serine/threonine protein kinase
VEEEAQRSSLAEGALVGGRFRVERLIGRGGMGEVYSARHVTTGKEVALKLIHAAAGAGREHVRRFMREARAATAIEHPNVIEVFDVFEEADGTPVMVMELLKGEPFSAYRERVGALRLHEVASTLLPVVRALKAAHDKGIVHRDLKPDNVFLAMTGDVRTPKLLDFGIAKMLDPTQIGSETQGQHTTTGSILGTPHYMSYEQAMSDKQVDHRTDIWSMGVMIFEALTGRRPMTYETLGEMYTAFLQGTVPPIRDYLPDLPADIATVIDRCLAKERASRLDDLGPLIDVLARYTDRTAQGAEVGGRVLAAVTAVSSTGAAATNEPLSSSLSSASPGRKSRPLLVAAGVVLGTAVVGAAGFALSRDPVKPPAQPQPTLGDSAVFVSTLGDAATDATEKAADAGVDAAVRPRPDSGIRPLTGFGPSSSHGTTSVGVDASTSAQPQHGIPEKPPY